MGSTKLRNVMFWVYLAVREDVSARYLFYIRTRRSYYLLGLHVEA